MSKPTPEKPRTAAQLGADSSADADRSIEQDELVRRVVYSLLMPAARLAKRFRLPLKEVTGWLQLAYFQEVRSSGLTLREASELLDVGMRKASELSKELKDNFFDPEREHGLPRRVEFMVWGEPLSRARIHQLLRDDSPDEVDRAIARLLSERRIAELPDRPDVFSASGTQARLYAPQWMAQIDGVNNFLASTLSATYNRVFRKNPSSLLRTLNFRMRPDDIDELHNFYEQQLFPFLAELEGRSSDADDAVVMDLSICWAPAPGDDD